MAEFYIEKTNQLIHKSDCSLLPKDKEATQYLGSLSNCGAAIKRATDYFKSANGCPECNAAFHAA